MKLTLDLKKTFHNAVRDAIASQDRWHMPAKIWLVRDLDELSFEAQPDTVHPGGSDSEILMALSADQLRQLAEADGTNQWDIEVNWLLDKALSKVE